MNFILSLFLESSFRAPLLINSSVAHVDLFEDMPATAAVRAAHVVYIEIMSHLAMDSQSIPPVSSYYGLYASILQLGNGLVCGRHYEKMYAISRVPDENCDYLVNYGISRHLVCLCRGNLYKIDVCDKNNRMFTVDQLTKFATCSLS